MIVLGIVALVARAAAAVVVDWPAFTDPAYYSLIAQRLAEGHGFTTPVLYSFLEVGSQLPDPALLPVPSNGHWMPLTSIVAAASMAVLGPTYARRHDSPRHPFGAARAAHLSRDLGAVGIPMGGDRGRRPGDLRRTAADHVSERRQLRRVRRHRRRIALLLDARREGSAARTLVGGGRRIRRTGDAGAHRRRAAHGGSGDRLVRAPRLVAMAERRNRWGQPGLGPCIGRCLPAGAGSVAGPERTVFGSPLPSAGGHTLWIRSYNEQFSIGHEVSLATYLDWGLPNIVLSKLNSWGELVGRTGVLLGGIFLIFFLAGLWMFRRRSELAPFYVYFAVMFFVMGALFTFHAPKGAFYHSAPAWLPWALGISAAAVASGANRRRAVLAVPPKARHAPVRCGRGPRRRCRAVADRFRDPVPAMGPVSGARRAGGCVPPRQRGAG